jgi:hypothetical protein
MSEKFSCDVHPERPAVSLCVHPGCSHPFMCDFCYVGHKISNSGHEKSNYALPFLLFDQLASEVARNKPGEVVKMIAALVDRLRSLKEVLEGVRRRLEEALDRFLGQTFSVSGIDAMEAAVVTRRAHLFENWKKEGCLDFGKAVNEYLGEVKAINVDTFQIKFSKIVGYFDKLGAELTDFADKKCEEIGKEIASVNSPVSISNMLVLSGSTVLKEAPARDFVGHTLVPPGQSLELLYRASRDGSTPQDFHTHCDLKGPTMVVAKSGVYVFGGFTEAPWTFEQVGIQKSCPNTFLFSVNKRQKYSVKLEHVANAIYCRHNCGPVFGKGGYDLFICAGNMSANGSTPCSFGAEGEGFSHLALAGTKDFDIDDYEVYRIRKET